MVDPGSWLEPYNEFGIMVPVLYEPARNVPGLPRLMPDRFDRFGLYVHHLPVTTEEARVVSRDHQGFAHATLPVFEPQELLAAVIEAEGLTGSE
ncbi:MAG TPA: acetoacetate decarboxylase family protein [Thermoleophilia bacterium]|nr:acetoacetate decarboxylase family protein [Thermoleophilia bacterium]